MLCTELPIASSRACCRRVIVLSLLIAILAVVGCADRSGRSAAARAGDARPTSGAVATVHPLATEAAADALRRGGNAVDAAVAAALTLGVVDGHNSGIGGGCFILVRRADGTFLAIDGRETAPAAATRDMYLRNGVADPRLSQTGPLASATPGALAAYDRALRTAGRLTLADLLLPAAEVAEKGFALNGAYARRLAASAKDLANYPESARVFLDKSGKPHPRGHLLRQPDLARTYRAIARQGIGWFYAGEFAQRTGGWMRGNGGILTAEDFARYQPKLREPLVTPYRGYTIVGFPPPSSGGVHVAQILGMLERFDLRALEQRDPAMRLHVTAEAMKLAFADRAHWLGDPDFVTVPLGLLDESYLAAQAQRIDPDRVIPVDRHGTPPRADENFFPGEGRHTTHIAAADGEGNIVALTTTINTGFGSKVVVPGTGVLLNNEMDDFSIQPGVPNAFKLIGSEANAIAPGKRPLSSMSPTLVLRDGRPVLTVGAAGGPTIITQVVQTIVNQVDLGMPIDRALAAPRIHHQWQPDELAIEAAMEAGIVAKLQARGHRIARRDHIGVTQAIAQDADGRLEGAADPRAAGTSARVPSTRPAER